MAVNWVWSLYLLMMAVNWVWSLSLLMMAVNSKQGM
jgi:hypothetical protein